MDLNSIITYRKSGKDPVEKRQFRGFILVNQA
jgi:hypothetical protein